MRAGAAAAVLALTAVTQVAAQTRRAVPLSLGGLFPLTGDRCAEGVHALFGARMAVEALRGDVMDTIMVDHLDPNEARLPKWRSFGAFTRSPSGNAGAPFELNVTFFEADSQGEKPEALYQTDNLIHKGVDAIIGPLTSSVTETVALLGKYDKTPVVSYYSPMAKLTSEATGLTTFMRTFPSDRTVIKASIDLIGTFGWEGVTFVTSNDEYGIDAAAEFSAYEANSKFGRRKLDVSRLKNKYVIYMDDDMEGIASKLDTIIESEGGWRIIVLHAPEELTAKILHVAKSKNMLSKGWVWIGTEWASQDLFAHCVWPAGADADAPDTCTNMTGVQAGVVADTWGPTGQSPDRKVWKQDEVVCPASGRDGNGGARYCLDEMSGDGTLRYMSEPEAMGLGNDGDPPLAGLVAVRVKESATPTAAELKTLFTAKKDALLTEFEAQCPELLNANSHMHRLSFFAFDAVMAAAKGAADYFECGSMADRADAMCTNGAMLIANTWEGIPINTRATGEVMNADSSGRFTSFAKGTSAMHGSILAAEVEDSATGNIGFTQVTESESSSGDPKKSQLEIVNFRANADGVGEWASVGEWTGSSDIEVDPDEDLPEMSADCMAGHCGKLTLDRDDDDQFSIVWPGGATTTPSDRSVKEHGAEAKYLLLVLLSLTAAMWAGSLLELMHFHYIPEAGMTCIIGMIVGVGIKLHASETQNHTYEDMAMFDESLFALVLLPIIIFDAGFGAKKARFFGNIGPILMTALVGTSISTAIVGLSTFALGNSGWSDVQFGFFESMTFGALVSAVDPVATLAVFGALKVETNLNYRVFGESIINDAVSIVLFRVFGTYMSKPWLGAESMLAAAKMFGFVGGGSIVMGMLMGFCASLVLKLSHIHDPLLAAGVFIMSSYVSYEISEAFHMSGIIASLFAGFCMRHYALVNIADKYQEMVLDMVHMLAQMSDLVIFFMVGENVILYTVREGVKVYLILWTIFLCLVGRVFNIFPLCAIYNAVNSVKASEMVMKKYEPNDEDIMIMLSIDDTDVITYDGLSEGKGDPAGVVLNGARIESIDGNTLTPETISKVVGWEVRRVGGEQPPVDFEGKRSDPEQTAAWKDISTKFEDGDEAPVSIEFDPRVNIQNQIVMFHSGLRGAIAFALALGFPSQHRDDVIDTTNCVILFTVFVLGGTTVPLLVGLGIPLGCGDDPEMLKLVDAKVLMQQAKEGIIKKGLKYRFLVLEDKLKQCITRSPKDELGLFATTWEELTEEQQAAAEMLGYTNDSDISNKLWPEANKSWGAWWELSDEKKESAMLLGLSEHKWPPPDMGRIGDADDLVMQHKGGHDTGYGEDSAEEDGEEGDKTTSNPVYSDDDEDGAD